MRQGESDWALRCLEQAAQADSAQEDSHLSRRFGGVLAQSYVRQGQLERGRTLADQLLARIPHPPVNSLLNIYEEALAHHRLAAAQRDSFAVQLLLPQDPQAHRDAAAALFDRMGVRAP